MANHLSQCNCRKSAPRKLATRYLTKERAHDDFAPPGQFRCALRLATPSGANETTARRDEFHSRPLTATKLEATNVVS